MFDVKLPHSAEYQDHSADPHFPVHGMDIEDYEQPAMAIVGTAIVGYDGHVEVWTPSEARIALSGPCCR